MAVAGGAIWLSLHNAAQLRCYNATTREQLAEINITPQVTRMLHGKSKEQCIILNLRHISDRSLAIRVVWPQ